MKSRMTLGLSAFVLAVIGACAVSATDNGATVEGDGGTSAAAGDGGGDATSAPQDGAIGVAPPTGDGGSPSVIDSGAATVGNGDSGSETEAGSGACNALSDCPYQSATNVAGVSCDTTNHVCVIQCMGDNYDVNGVLSDGCEVANPCPLNAPNGGSSTPLCPVEHAVANATYLGAFSCTDSSSAQDVIAAVPSDARVHTDPAVVAFDATTGAAPTVFSLQGTGGLCDDDLNLTLQVKSPSTHLACYSLVAQVVGGSTYTCAQTDPTGLCQISNGSGSYADGDTITITVSKIETCLAGEPDDGAFELTGHL